MKLGPRRRGATLRDPSEAMTEAGLSQARPCKHLVGRDERCGDMTWSDARDIPNIGGDAETGNAT